MAWQETGPRTAPRVVMLTSFALQMVAWERRGPNIRGRHGWRRRRLKDLRLLAHRSGCLSNVDIYFGDDAYGCSSSAIVVSIWMSHATLSSF